MKQTIRRFLATQLDVITRRFGADSACQSFQRVCRQLVPELQEVSARYGFEGLIAD